MMGRDTTTGPVCVEVVFHFKRPASHYRGKSGELREGVPTRFAHGVQRGDLDKLLRAVLDALTGVAFADDRQVVDIHASALIGDVDATRIAVWETAS
jgi:crossover junction endodeoxyribonuclease RusA